MIKAISLRPEMGQAVLAHLGKLAALPKFGVVAGQAVASAIDDLFGKGGGVFNDLDIFLPSSGSLMTPEDAASAFAERHTPTMVTNVGYGGSSCRHLEMVQTYRVEAVRYAGLLNRIYFRMPKIDLRCADHTKRLISGFDINAVRVGVCLVTKQLVWDEHYEQFLRTRELRISACYTPAHSLMRLLKKSRELADVTVDIETAARVTAMLQTEQLFKSLRASQAVSYFFGDKFVKMAESFRSSWAPFYDLNEAWFHRPTEASKWCVGSGDETSVDAKLLNRIEARGALDTCDEVFAENLGGLSVTVLPGQVYRQRDARRSNRVSVLGIPATPPALEDTHTANFASLRGSDYYEGLDLTEDGTDVTALTSFVNHHTLAGLTMGFSAAQQLDCVRKLVDLVAELRAPDAKQVVLETAVSLQTLCFANIERLVREKFASERELSHPLAAPLPLMSDCPVPSLQALRLREVRTVRELKELALLTGIRVWQPESGRWGSKVFVLQPSTDERQCGLLKVNVDGNGCMTSSELLYGPWLNFSDRPLYKEWAEWLVDWWVERQLMPLPAAKALLLLDDDSPF